MENFKLVVFMLFLIANILGFFLVGYDKRQAGIKGWRVAERRFFGLALVGGALGVYLGMKCFRHKTKHARFSFGIPLLIAINIAMFYYVYKLI